MLCQKTIIIKVEHLNIPPTPLKTFSVPTRHLYFRECISATALTLTLRKTHYPSKNTIFLPPLSKGGGLTARHKLSLCCIFTCDTSAFFIHQTFCRQDGGIAIPPFAQHHIYASLVKGEVLSPEKIRATTGGIALHHQPFQNRTIPRKSPPPLPPLEKGEVARLI